MQTRSMNKAGPSKVSTISEHAASILDTIKSVVFDDNALTYPDPSFFSKTSFIQLGYGIWVGLGPCLVGMAFGYSAVAVPMLQADKEMSMSERQLSWFASIVTLSSPFGCVVSGYIADKLGRRMAIITAEAPMALGWLYISLAGSPINLIIGRAVMGVGIGMILPPSRVYVSEVSLPNMRGINGTLVNLSVAIGITWQAVLGMYLSWRVLCNVSCVLSIGLLLLYFLFLPDTPYFVLMTDTEEKAKNTLQKFRSTKHNINAEMREIVDFKTRNNIHELSFKEKIQVMTKPASCKPFWTISLFCLIVQLAGVTVLSFWTIIILENSKSCVEPKLGNSLVASGRIFGSLLSSILTYSWKRRTLSFISGVGVFFAFLCLSVNTMVTDKPSLVPQICVMLCVIFACIGYYSMPMLMMSELYPLQVRGILGGLSVSWLNLLIFGANMSFMPMMNHLGFTWTMFQYGIWSLLGVIVLYFILPETRDLTLQEIEEYYNEKRPSLTSQRKLESDILMSRPSMGVLFGKKDQTDLSRKSGLDIMRSNVTIMDVIIQQNIDAKIYNL